LLFADGIRVRRWCFFLCCDAFSLSLGFDVKRKSTWLKCVFLSSFKNLLLFKNCQKRSSDLIMKWTRLLHHAFVLQIVVSHRVEETFGAFCWNLRGCWGAHQNRFLVNFLTHSLPRCLFVYFVIACYTLFELRLQYTVVSGLHNAFSGELYFHQELPFSNFGKDHIKCVWFLALSLCVGSQVCALIWVILAPLWSANTVAVATRWSWRHNKYLTIEEATSYLIF
jgi:hypothetical protein